MNHWDSVGRWINTLLVFIVGVLAFDALFRLLEANEGNVIVVFVRGLAVVFLVPFQGMFGEQDFVLTTLIGVLGYALLAGIALGVLRSLQASRAQPAPPVRSDAAAVPPLVAEHPTSVPASTDATPSPAGRTADSAQTPRTPPGDAAERSDRARTNGRSRAPRARPGADGAERTRSGSDGRERLRRGRSRDRAAAKRGSGSASEADTGT